MANIDELHFQVILDDTAFQQKIANIEQAAQKLNTTVTQLLQIQASISATSDNDVKNAKAQNQILRDNAKTKEQIQRMADKTALANQRNLDILNKQRALDSSEIDRKKAENAERAAQAAIRTATAQERLNKLQREGNAGFLTQHRLLRDMVTMAGSYLSLWGATTLVKNLVNVSAEFELQRTTLAAILQDVEQANKLYGQMKELAVISPFNFKDLTTYAKQLSAYSIPINELYDTTKMLADVSAGLGVDMNRLVLAYGQIRSASFLRGQEVRQLTEAGIPILEELRKQFEAMNGVAVSAGDVFDKISARQVPFEMVAKVFKDMTSEGGKFYKMQEVQADTLKGKLSNLVDAYQIMFSEIGENQDGFLKGSVDAVRSMIENYKTLGRVLITVASTIGMFKTTAIMADIAKWYEGFAQIGARARAMGVQVSNATIIMRAFKASLKGLGAGLTVAAFTALAMGIYQAAKAAHELERSLQKIGQTKLNEAEKSIKTFNELLRSMENMTEGSQAYRNAIAQLNRQYGEYLPNLLNEKTTLSEIKAISDQVVQSIRNRAKAYAYEQGVQEINDKYIKAQIRESKIITSWLAEQGQSEENATAAIMKFRDAVLETKDASKAGILFTKTMQEFFNTDWIDGMGDMQGNAKKLAKSFLGADRAAAQYENTLNSIFGATSTYSSLAEKNAIDSINKDYENAKERVNREKLTNDQYDAEIKRLEISRISDLIEYYERLGGEDKSRLDMIKKYKGELESMTKTTTGWQAKVNAVLEANGLGKTSAGKLWATETDSLVEYWDTLRKTYKEVYKTDDEMKSLKENNESLYETYVKQKKAIEEVGKALGVSIDDKIKKKSTKGKTPEQIALEAQVENVKKLMALYEQMKKMGIGDETAKRWFAAFAPGNEEITNTLRFREALEGYANTLRNVYKDVKGAQAIETLLGSDGIKEAMDAYGKLESLRGKLQSWIAEDFNIAGKGIAFDINKLASELNSKNNAVDTRLNDLKLEFQEATKSEAAIAAIREKYGHEAWAKYLDEGESALEQLASKEKEYNKATAEEKVRDLAKNYVKEWEGLAAFDLSDWGNKTIMELKDIQKAIDSFDPSKLPSDLRNALLQINGPDGIEEFSDKFREALGIVGEKVKEQLKKEKIQQVKEAAQGFGQLADAASKVAEAFGNANLKDLFDSLKDVASGIAGAFEAGMMGDWVGFVSEGATSVFNIAMRSVSSIQEQKRAIAEAREEARRYKEEMKLDEGVETLFGANSGRALQNAINQLRELGRLTDEDKKKTALFYQAFDKASGELSLKKSQRKVDLRKAVEDLGYELVDEYGNLNSKALQAVLDTYKNLDSESREWLEHAINDTEMYAQAMEQLKKSVSDVFGSLADDMAETLIDEYMEIGDATVDLAENMDNIFSDLAQSIAKNLVSAFILDNVLDKYQNDVESFYKQMGEGNLSEEQIASYFSTLAEGIKNDTETAAEFTNRLMDALKAQGITFSDEESGSGLSNGIKSITEDTANLLASYINAIRADVAASRVSLTDIQTNTFRSAIAAEGILTKLTSMMGSFSGGGDGIKVIMQ